VSKRKRINGPFAARTIEMLRSPAMRVLSLTGRRILDRIEIELATHGGKDNGKLPVTHADFRQFGIDHDAIGAGIREVCALGFVQLTRRGRAGVAGHRCPSLFEITYRPIEGAEPTNAWRQIATVEEAEQIAARARAQTETKLEVQTEWEQFPNPVENPTKPWSGKPGLTLVRETRTEGWSGKPGVNPQKPWSGKPGVLSRYLAIYLLREGGGSPVE
jgi:hypothetical protein